MHKGLIWGNRRTRQKLLNTRIQRDNRMMNQEKTACSDTITTELIKNSIQHCLEYIH